MSHANTPAMNWCSSYWKPDNPKNSVGRFQLCAESEPRCERMIGQPEAIQKRACGKRRNRFPRCRFKSTRRGRIPSFWSHCLRLMPSLKPDCACAQQRKTGTVPRSQLSSPFSPVRFSGELSRNTGIFRIFREKGSWISLPLRLAGGGSVIRTRITVLNPATHDVCVTCRWCSTLPESQQAVTGR